MFKKLCILLIFSKLKVTKLLIDKYRMHNLYAIFAKLLNICKQIAGNLVNESGNVPRRGVVPKFSDLEVVALNMASEAVGIDSESLLFAKLQEYRVEIPNLISRRQYNDRRKITSSLCNAIRERMVSKMDGGEDYFCIDSKPIEVCRIARSKRCSMGKKDFRKAPGVGYCASQSMYYYGYKLHAVCWLSGIIHSFDLTKASVHDIHYLKDVKVDYSNCTVIGDRGYISAQVQLDLFETANIRLEVPYRCNQKEWKPTFPAFAKARKRIETLFSQLCDQFMIIRNYAKDTDGLFARIIGKISALTILQYINYLLAELNYKRFMFKKLCILLIFSKLNEIKHLIDKYRMHNLYAIFAKLLNICKQIAGNLVNESGNVPRRGVVPKFSDLEVVALNMASEAVGIDSESLLFAKLQEYRVEIPNLISRRQYNDRRKITSSLCNAIRERMVSKMDGGEDYFCIDSKPIEVCRIARSKRCSMGKKDFRKAPGVGYCASQSMYYYGYKLHAVCWLSGIIHSFDLTKASVHDIHYLKDVKVDYSNCTVIGDRGYISAQVQLDLFETANIRLEVPYRCNQKEWKPTFPAFAKARKRIETLFSQLCDQFMIIRNYAKDTDGLFARIIGKISALTILQYINYKNEKPIGRVKYALF